MHDPSMTHSSTSKRVLCYLKNSVDHGLIYTKSNLHFSAYCDDNWSARKQAVVSRSTTEVEYRALAITATNLFLVMNVV